MTPEQKQRQSEAMKARWADPEFRKKQSRSLRKAAKMATARKNPDAMLNSRLKELNHNNLPSTFTQLEVRLDDLMATRSHAGLVGATEASWVDTRIPVPVGYRISSIVLESAK